MKGTIDNYIKICVSIISGSILFVIGIIFSVIIYVNFFEKNDNSIEDRRQEHVENHIKEAKNLDEIIKILEEINNNLDERKI